jgi:hypothetical protein
VDRILIALKFICKMIGLLPIVDEDPEEVTDNTID